ncbi:MAG: HAMP domain-containing protein [Hespellia sp.]|nr:HAMP domain-containing protein [Hespellia sp.]
MFKNLKVRTKLITAFGIVIILYLITVIASYIGLKSVSGGLKEFYSVPYPTVVSSLNAQSATRAVQLDLWRAYGSSDNATLQNHIAKANEDAQVMSAAIESLKSYYEGDAALLQEVEANATATANARVKAMEYLQAHDLENALTAMNGEYLTNATNFNNSLQEVIDNSSNMATEYYQEGMNTNKVCFIILLVLAVVSVILTVILVITITRDLTRPILELEEAMKRMAKGDMQSEIEYSSKDELGVLADNSRFVLKTLSEYVQHICARLEALASGDLTVEMDMDYLGEFESIKESGTKIIESLNDTLGQLQQAADQVASGSEQVSNGAQALSQGATEQASSVQELAATINELSSQVSQTAQNSREINGLISETGRELNSSNEKMDAMMSAMAKISDSSSEIEKIIKTIEDIAFQTNILALNAAVEAARAGEAGKGFAVVADEVRSLASKSQEAAKDTTALISNSLTAVSEGNQIAAETLESLQTVVSSAQKITETMAKITEASDMQAEGIQQVTLGIDQISSVVQTNSATAEESAAASEELFSQSSLLKSLVGRFQLKGFSGVPMATQARVDNASDDDDFMTFDDSKY